MQQLALYRKYRSQDWDEVVGQDHITTSLQNAVKHGRIAHAYLFTGPRGVGKTSVARILARAVNGLAYEDGRQHLDIIEIDAASNRRIDEIRDLRDKIHIAPISAQYKVYIIDEVHMLTKEAFNALLKTLEEPPAHAVFILATTEAHKLPATIVSRTQRHAFKPLPGEQMVKHLRDIADKEKIKIDDEALALIAEHGEGSFRDSISLLDQLRNHDKAVTAAVVRELIGLPPRQGVQALAAACSGGSSSAVIDALTQLREQGFGASMVARELFMLLRERAINGQSTAGDLELMDGLLSVPGSFDPEAQLEILLLRPTIQERPVEQLAQFVEPVEEYVPLAAEPESLPEPVATPAPKTKKASKPKVSTDLAGWDEVLGAVKDSNNALYAVLRMAQPRKEGATLTLAFSFPFHKQRAEESRNLELLNKAAASHWKEELEIICVVDAEAARPSIDRPNSVAAEAIMSPTQRVIDTFGGGEVVDL